MFNRIRSIDVLPNFHLQLTYEDGMTTEADFNPIIQQGGVFSALADPAFFSEVSLGEHGRIVQWPGELEFCADALRPSLSAHEQGIQAVSTSQPTRDTVIVAEDL